MGKNSKNLFDKFGLLPETKKSLHKEIDALNDIIDEDEKSFVSLNNEINRLKNKVVSQGKTIEERDLALRRKEESRKYWENSAVKYGKENYKYFNQRENRNLVIFYLVAFDIFAAALLLALYFNGVPI